MAEQMQNVEDENNSAPTGPVKKTKLGEDVIMKSGLKKGIAVLGIVGALGAATVFTTLTLNGCEHPTGTTQQITKYTVSFYNDSTLLKSETVLPGGSATPPNNPTKAGFTFDGWDGNYTDVRANTNVYAKWKEQTKVSDFPAKDRDVTFTAQVGQTSIRLLTPGNSTDETSAGGKVQVALRGMRNQANNFIAWSQNAAANNPALAAQFNAIASRETNIRNTIAYTTNPLGYPANAEIEIDGMLDVVVGNNGTADRNTFDANREAHYKGTFYDESFMHNVMSDADCDVLLNEFNDLAAALGVTTGSVQDKLGVLRVNMENLIADKFGFRSGNTFNADEKADGMDMVRVLITQIADDLPQFKALANDLEAKGMNAGHSVNPIGMADLAAVNTRAGQIINNFSPDALKPRSKEEEEQQIAGRTAMA